GTSGGGSNRKQTNQDGSHASKRRRQAATTSADPRSGLLSGQVVHAANTIQPSADAQATSIDKVQIVQLCFRWIALYSCELFSHGALVLCSCFVGYERDATKNRNSRQ